MIYSSSRTWMRISSATAKQQKKHRRETTKKKANRMISYSLFFLPLFFPLVHPNTHTHSRKHTHINSPLGVCCFHYLQLGPETAFRLEYSRADCSIYRGKSGNCQLSVLSILCVRWEVWLCGIWGPPLLGPSPHRAPVMGGKTASLKASESPTTATLTAHTVMGIKHKNNHTKREKHLKIYPSYKSHFSCLACYAAVSAVAAVRPLSGKGAFCLFCFTCQEARGRVRKQNIQEALERLLNYI